MRFALLTTLYCILGENAHLIYQYIYGLDDPATYYFITDLSMYSVKAVLACSVIWYIKTPPELKAGILMVYATLAIYYTLDCANMFIFGNYDGLLPMLLGMSVSIMVACAIHFGMKYQIVKKKGKNKIGF